MGYWTLTDEVAPSTPSAGRGTAFFDSADNGRLKVIRPDGQIYIMNMSGFDKNLLINGGFDFFQRQVPGTLTTRASTTARVYGPDRWGMTQGAASGQCIRVDTNAAPETGLSSRYYGRFVQISGAGKQCQSQVIEGHAVMPLRGRKVRLQVKVKRAGGAYSIRLGLVQLNSAGAVDTWPATFISAFNGASTDPTFGTNLAIIAPDANSGVGGSVSGNAVTYATTTGWVNVGGVWTVPTNCKGLAFVVFTDGTMAVNDEMHLGEAGLYDGPDMIDWIPMPFQLDYDRARRFYEKSFTVDQNPTTNVGVNTGELRGVAGKAGAVANSGFITHQYAIEKRATPTTLTVYNPAAANALARNITGAADMGATAITGSNAKSFYTNSTGVVATAVGDLIAIHYSSDAEL